MEAQRNKGNSSPFIALVLHTYALFGRGSSRAHCAHITECSVRRSAMRIRRIFNEFVMNFDELWGVCGFLQFPTFFPHFVGGWSNMLARCVIAPFLFVCMHQSMPKTWFMLHPHWPRRLQWGRAQALRARAPQASLGGSRSPTALTEGCAQV